VSDDKRDRALVFVVRNRRSLLESVIPFFERVPIISSKRRDFEKFAWIVRAMAAGRHLTAPGFRELLELALSMNGNGRYRRILWNEQAL
jgi:hypothetical protein